MAGYSGCFQSDYRWRQTVEKERSKKGGYPWVLDLKPTKNQPISRVETRACTPSEFPSFLSCNSVLETTFHSRQSISQDDKSTLTDSLKLNNSFTQTTDIEINSPKFKSFKESKRVDFDEKLIRSSPLGRDKTLPETDRSLQQSWLSVQSSCNQSSKGPSHSLREKSNITKALMFFLDTLEKAGSDCAGPLLEKIEWSFGKPARLVCENILTQIAKETPNDLYSLGPGNFEDEFNFSKPFARPENLEKINEESNGFYFNSSNSIKGISETLDKVLTEVLFLKREIRGSSGLDQSEML